MLWRDRGLARSSVSAREAASQTRVACVLQRVVTDGVTKLAAQLHCSQWHRYSPYDYDFGPRCRPFVGTSSRSLSL